MADHITLLTLHGMLKLYPKSGFIQSLTGFIFQTASYLVTLFIWLYCESNQFSHQLFDNMTASTGYFVPVTLGLVWFSCVLWHIKPCGLFNAKSCYYIYIYIYIKEKLATVVEGDLKAPFSLATKPKCREGCYPFPWIAYLTLDPCLGGSAREVSCTIFLSFWYESTRDWTPVSKTIGEHLHHCANEPVHI